MVKITDRFYINATANCYSLQEKTKIKDKNSKNFGQDIYKDKRICISWKRKRYKRVNKTNKNNEKLFRRIKFENIGSGNKWLLNLRDKWALKI